MSRPLTFQQVILRLQEFWAEHGCLIWQPYSEKVGAGTMNPATVLRVLGPEPWHVAYVEPSYRPDDGRYGENPNRMQMHTQFQVILKPDPGNPQELYLESLAALGIRREEHTFASSRTTGRAPRWGPGGWAGKSGWTGWRSPSSPTSSRRGVWPSIRYRWSLPTVSSGSQCSCSACDRFGRSIGTAGTPTATSCWIRR